jgi:P pilus assembly chaperone PapD
MKLFTFVKGGMAALCLATSVAHATGMVPETSIVIVEEADGEGGINVQNTDNFPVLLTTTLENIPEDTDELLIVTPPAARVEPGKNQRVRFMLTNKEPLKTERLKRVIFEGIPPQQKGKNEVRMTIRQNIPVIIRPAGLARADAPWEQLTWKLQDNSILLSNPSPYVVRLAQSVQTLPDNTTWILPNTYVLPGQALALTPDGGRTPTNASQVRISPATIWGFTVNSYDASLTR